MELPSEDPNYISEDAELSRLYSVEVEKRIQPRDEITDLNKENEERFGPDWIDEMFF